MDPSQKAELSSRGSLLTREAHAFRGPVQLNKCCVADLDHTHMHSRQNYPIPEIYLRVLCNMSWKYLHAVYVLSSINSCPRLLCQKVFFSVELESLSKDHLSNLLPFEHHHTQTLKGSTNLVATHSELLDFSSPTRITFNFITIPLRTSGANLATREGSVRSSPAATIE